MKNRQLVYAAPQWLARTRERLRDACFETPRLSDLAKIAGVHPVYFARAFRHRYGCSPGEYLRHLWKLGQLYLDGGNYQGKKLISPDWVKQSVKAHASMDDQAGVEYGYLWWLMQFPVKEKIWKSFSMNGSGGNTVQVFPEQHVVVVITTSNFNAPQPHRITAKLLTEKILPVF